MKKNHVSEEHLKYAATLKQLTIIGFGLFVIGFIIYLTGLLPSIVPISDGINVKAESFNSTFMPAGWGWVYYLDHGDVLSLLGIAFLISTSIFCFIRILPIFLKKKDTIFVSIIILQLFIFVLAASGILESSH